MVKLETCGSGDGMAQKPNMKLNDVSTSRIGTDRSADNLMGPPPPYDQWVWKSMGARGISRTYNEALQGCANDCHFIAALSAAAWVGYLPADSNPKYKFYKITLSGDKYTAVLDEVSLGSDALPGYTADPNNKDPIFARPDASGETWAMLYEKAYAKWLGDRTNDKPDIGSELNGGNGFTALMNITGKTNGKEVGFSSGDALVTDLELSKTANKKIPKAAVIWTKTTIQSPLVGLYKNHVYTVLGSYYENREGKTKKPYIVLRNPYGGIISDPEPVDSAYVPEPGGIPAWNGIDLNKTNDGIFAFDLSKFSTSLFDKYGYVK